MSSSIHGEAHALEISLNLENMFNDYLEQLVAKNIGLQVTPVFTFAAVDTQVSG